MDQLTASLRNVPVQARSRERLTRVLDAAETILATEGAETLTTTRVAQVAGVPVGSVYHYFPDKETIVDAVAMRYWSDFGDLVDALAEADARDPLADPVGAIFKTLARGFRAQPGFRALWYSSLRTQRVRDATRATRATFERAVGRILARHWPRVDTALRASAARMVVLTGDGLLREAFRVDADGDEQLLAETALMLNAYLDTRLGERTR